MYAAAVGSLLRDMLSQPGEKIERQPERINSDLLRSDQRGGEEL